MSDLLKLLIAVLLVAVNGFFVAAEFAMIRVRQTRVEEMAEQGNASARVVLSILSRLDTFLAATQLGITMANLALGYLGEPAVAHLLMPLFRLTHIGSPGVIATVSGVVGFVLVTIAEVVFGELLPKWSVIQNTDRAAALVAYPMNLFVRVFYPLIQFLKWFAGLFARIIGINPAQVGMMETPHSPDEIVTIVEKAEEIGTIGAGDAELVENIFEFTHTQAQEIMVPRVDIVYLNSQLSLKENAEIAVASGYTRFPLCDGDRDNIIGMVHRKDLVALTGQENGDIRSIVREMPVIPETKRIAGLLRDMQRAHSHMAVVLDEYGGTAGVVTLEDIIEEIVGEIQDEHDRPGPIERLPNGSITVAGTELLETVADELGISFDNGEEYQSLGGYARHVLGLAPTTGATARVEGYRIMVAEAQRQRILRLIFEPLAPSAGDHHATNGRSAPRA